MKIVWGVIRSGLEIAAQTLLYWPLVLAAAVNLIRHFSLWAVILLAASALSAWLVNFAVLNRHDANINRELFATLAQYPNYRFEKRDMKELVNRYASYEKIQGMLYQNNLKEIGEAYVAVPEDESGAEYFSNPLSFPRVFFPNVVLLPEDMENGGIRELFFFFHELGHLTTNHTKLNVLAARSVIGAACTFFIAACLFPWYLTLALVPFARIWHGSCAGVSLMISNESGQIERLADAFALKVLQNHPDINRLEEALTRMGAKDRRFQLIQESMRLFKDWFSDTKDMDETIASLRGRLNAPENSRLAFLLRHGLSSEAVNYNTLIETHCFPYHFWPAYCLCALLIAGCALREPTTAQYILLSVAPLLASALAARKYALKRVCAQIMAEAKLEGKTIVAPTLKRKRQLEKSVAPPNEFWQWLKKKAAVTLAEGEKRKPLTYPPQEKD